MAVDTLIITYDKFPQGDAGSLRCECLAKMLLANGLSPLVIGMGRGDKSGIYTSIPYYSLFDEHGGKRNYVWFHQKLKIYLDTLQISYIVLVNPPLPTWIYLKHYCRKNHVILLHDSVEWYSKEQFKRGRFSYFYLEKTLENRFLVKNMRVIAISRYLYDYYTAKNIPCLRIPVILDKEEFPVKKKEHGKVCFQYAGTPGKKDYLDVMMNAFALWKKEDLQDIEIHLYGVRDDQLKVLLDEACYEKLKPHVLCHGRVSRNEVLEAYSQCDYTMLYRDPSLRYAKAGFPTKVVESLMSGVPIVTNISSDLGKYLEDEKNAVLCKENTTVAFSKALQRAYMLHKKGEYPQLSMNARKLAEEAFDYRLYEEDLQKFMKESV